MPQHRSSASPVGVSINARDRKIGSADTLDAAEVTDIIPFDEFGKLSDLEFPTSSAFDQESRVIYAPELDDMHHTDDLTSAPLAVPSEFRAGNGSDRGAQGSSHVYRDSHTDVSDGNAATDVIDMRSRRGAHRREARGRSRAAC